MSGHLRSYHSQKILHPLHQSQNYVTVSRFTISLNYRCQMVRYLLNLRRILKILLKTIFVFVS
jgi:hypothetical protein